MNKIGSKLIDIQVLLPNSLYSNDGMWLGSVFVDISRLTLDVYEDKLTEKKTLKHLSNILLKLLIEFNANNRLYKGLYSIKNKDIKK